MVLTEMTLDPERLAVLAPCMENHGVLPEWLTEDDQRAAEWPNNMISRSAVVYTSGRVARRDEVVAHQVDQEELALCRTLAQEAAEIMRGVEVGMGSDASDEFFPFYVAAHAGDPEVTSIDEAFIRRCFGGTLFPLVTMTIEPLEERGTWWSEVTEDPGPDGLEAWRQLMLWFSVRPELRQCALVRVGISEELEELREEELPVGTVIVPGVLPRPVVGLTHQGSLTGLFGHSVQS